MDVDGCPFGSFNTRMAFQGIFRKEVTSFLDESLAATFIARSNNRKRKRSESELVAQQPPAIVQQPPAIVQQPSALAVCNQISRGRQCKSQELNIPAVFGMW
jgi:hypothetical protein